MSLKIFSIFILVISTFLPLSPIHANEQFDAAWGLKRILKLDETIRTSTGKTLAQKKNRGIIFKNNEKGLQNLIETWNYIPTTDRTLDYKLTLQKYKLSCEIAAVKIILSGLGYTKSEDDIIKELPHHNKPMNKERGVWGDPDIEFVGLYQGSQNDKTGYGIYEAALKKYFYTHYTSIDHGDIKAWNEISRPVGFTNQTHMSHLLETIDNGGHVILWGDWCTAPEYEDGIVGRDKTLIKKIFPISGKNTCKNYQGYRYFNWKTENGKDILALSGDHVFVLLGYIGKKDNPSHIIVWDTDTGRHIYQTNEWMRKWGMMQYRSLSISGESKID